MTGGNIKTWLIGMLLVFGVVTAGAFNAHGEDAPMNIKLFCDSQKREVSARVTLSSPNHKPILMYIISAGDDNFDPNLISNENISSMLYGIEKVNETNGAYTAAIKIGKNAGAGWYKLIVSDTLSVDGTQGINLADRAVKFYYADPPLVLDAITAINSAPESGIGGVLEQYKHVFGIDTAGEYVNVSGAANTAFLAVRKYQYGNSFAQLGQINSAFETAVGAALMISSPEGALENLFLKYNSFLELDLTEDYTAHKADVHRLFVQLRPQGFHIQSNPKTDIGNAFKQCVAIAMVNDSNRKDLTEVLTKYNSVLGLDLTGDYAKMNQIEVNKALERKNFTSIGEIKTAFENRINELKGEAVVIEKKSSPSGGGGGAKTSITAALPVPVQPASPKFTDIGSVEWARASIEYLAGKGVVSGDGRGQFHPDENVTREQFVKMLSIAFGFYDSAAAADFHDVDKTQWSYAYIASAKKKGIVNGKGDGTFGLGETITRQEMAVLAYRAAKTAGITLADKNKPIAFHDADEIEAYAAEGVAAMQKAGVINGLGGNSFGPNESTTRAQAAKIIYGLLEGVK